MKKTILVSLAGLVIFLTGCTQQTPTPNINQPNKNLDQEINKKYFDDPKFCIQEDDCISYTLCNNQNEPRNKYYDNSLTPNYNPEQKCTPDYFAYAGSDVKCENNLCQYRRCYALPIKNTNAGNQGISISEYYSGLCLGKTNKAECESFDIYSDGSLDCIWK